MRNKYKTKDKELDAFLDFLHVDKKNTEVFAHGTRFIVLVDKPLKRKWYKLGRK